MSLSLSLPFSEKPSTLPIMLKSRVLVQQLQRCPPSGARAGCYRGWGRTRKQEGVARCCPTRAWWAEPHLRVRVRGGTRPLLHRGLGLRLTASVGAQPLRRWAALPAAGGGEASRATASVSVRPCCLCGPGSLQRLETVEEARDKHVILGHPRSPRPRGLDLVLMGSSFEWEQCKAVFRPGRGVRRTLETASPRHNPLQDRGTLCRFPISGVIQRVQLMMQARDFAVSLQPVPAAGVFLVCSDADKMQA